VATSGSYAVGVIPSRTFFAGSPSLILSVAPSTLASIQPLAASKGAVDHRVDPHDCAA